MKNLGGITDQTLIICQCIRLQIPEVLFTLAGCYYLLRM